YTGIISGNLAVVLRVPNDYIIGSCATDLSMWLFSKSRSDCGNAEFFY
ncbi:8277_t:CDS:2, partial [Acaulospora morrowiae]